VRAPRRGRVYGVRRRGELGEVSEADAQRVIAAHEGLVRHVAYRTHIPPGAPFDRTDLFSLGRVALLQAHATFDSERGVKFGTWAYTLIRQAVFDAVKNGVRERAVPFSALSEGWSADAVPDEHPGADVVFEARSRRAWLKRKLSNGVLNERERSVLRLRLEGRTLADVGAAHGLSREWIRLTEAAAIGKLRQAAHHEGLV